MCIHLHTCILPCAHISHMSISNQLIRKMPPKNVGKNLPRTPLLMVPQFHLSNFSRWSPSYCQQMPRNTNAWRWWLGRALAKLWLVRMSKMGVSPQKKGYIPSNHPFYFGFSIVNHPFWGFSPYFWKHPNGRVVGSKKPSQKTGAPHKKNQSRSVGEMFEFKFFLQITNFFGGEIFLGHVNV